MDASTVISDRASTVASAKVSSDAANTANRSATLRMPSTSDVTCVSALIRPS
ncbi:Uncharacterised protein [Mycobacteroides abscessus subsp. abscessus]|nr:Uncharacterised protein [Mycobacteroides abscessus subsp. abscessus]